MVARRLALSLILVLFALFVAAQRPADFELDETRIIPPAINAWTLMGYARPSCPCCASPPVLAFLWALSCPASQARLRASRVSLMINRGRPASDRFSVRLDKATNARLIVGSSQTSKGTPAVLIYRSIPNQLGWLLEASLEPPLGDGQQSEYGTRVEIHGNYAAVSSMYAGTNGAVYIYTLSDGSWRYTTRLESPQSGNSNFGMELSMSATHLLVAAKRTQISAATADFFLFELASLAAPPRTLPPIVPIVFAHNVWRGAALTPTHAFLGYPALLANYSSYLFVYNLADLTQNQTIALNEPTFATLSASGALLATGPVPSYTGAVRVFSQSAVSGLWSEEIAFTSMESSLQLFGTSLAIDSSTNRLVVGIPIGDALSEVMGTLLDAALPPSLLRRVACLGKRKRVHIREGIHGRVGPAYPHRLDQRTCA